ncbi:MAG: hypothetical protein GY875_14050 [Gammaproteobacteria bacterium]|nr:hypothetical protein [Gammaproteobacteria bacterium]
MTGRKFIRQKLALTLGLLLSFPVYCAAENWVPQESIQIFVPSGKGDATDQLARVLAEELESALNQKIIIINKTGRAGSLATEKVLQAPADGYTWLAGAASSLGTYQLRGKLDTKIQDWHVYLAASQALVVSANPDRPVEIDLVSGSVDKSGSRFLHDQVPGRPACESSFGQFRLTLHRFRYSRTERLRSYRLWRSSECSRRFSIDTSM